MLAYIAAASGQPVHITNVPTAAGFSSADWLAVITILISFFGLALGGMWAVTTMIVNDIKRHIEKIDDGLEEFKDSVGLRIGPVSGRPLGPSEGLLRSSVAGAERIFHRPDGLPSEGSGACSVPGTSPKANARIERHLPRLIRAFGCQGARVLAYVTTEE